MIENLKSKKILLLISAGMMEITWLYALACILFLMLNAPVFPIWTTVLSFFTPVIITSILKGRGRRVIEHFILYTFFYFVVLLYTFYIYGNWQDSFLNFNWLKMILHQQYGLVGGVTYLSIIFWLSVFWISGYKLANRSNDYFMITSRFDLGITGLVITFIILGSMNFSFPHSGTLIIYYFLFSMFTISLAKNLKSSKTKYLKRFSGTSLILTFILIVLLIGSWVVLFFLPQLSSTAQAAYYVLKIVSKPLGNILIKIIFLLFGFRKSAASVGSGNSGNSDISAIENSDPGWWTQLLEWVITRGGLILLSLIVIVVISWLLWSLWKWFSTKTEVDVERKGIFEELLLWFLHLFSFGKKALYKILDISKIIQRRQENISILFQKLCRWGRSSGIPREISQTPQEYANYLSHFFPDSQNDIQLIVESFNREIYRKKTIPSEQIKKTKKAWKRLSGPSKWPLRLWIKIFYSRKFNSQEATSSIS